MVLESLPSYSVFFTKEIVQSCSSGLQLNLFSFFST